MLPPALEVAPPLLEVAPPFVEVPPLPKAPPVGACELPALPSLPGLSSAQLTTSAATAPNANREYAPNPNREAFGVVTSRFYAAYARRDHPRTNLFERVTPRRREHYSQIVVNPLAQAFASVAKLQLQSELDLALSAWALRGKWMPHSLCTPRLRPARGSSPSRVGVVEW